MQGNSGEWAGLRLMLWAAVLLLLIMLGALTLDGRDQTPEYVDAVMVWSQREGGAE